MRLIPTLIYPIYNDPAHYDLLAQMTAPDDLPFYRRLVERFPGPVLEVGCGTGRIVLPLASQGVSVTGIDNSPAMLEYARAKMAWFA